MGWNTTVRLNHEFAGRKALETELASPRRTVATLRWNADDVLDIYRSLFQPGEEYRTLDLPTTPPWSHGMTGHADHLLKDGNKVGYSSGTIYSYHYREVLSMACIDLNHSKIGTEVVVQWGDHGRRIKNVRATVERFPYLTEGRNSDVDTKRLEPKPPTVNRGWVVAKASRGVYSPDCLLWEERPVPALGNDQVLVKTGFLSLDPTSRNWLKLDPHAQYLPIKIGDVMLGVAIGVVVDSRSSRFAAGDVVTGTWGWEEYSVANQNFLERVTLQPGEPLEGYLSIFSHVGRAAVTQTTQNATVDEM